MKAEAVWARIQTALALIGSWCGYFLGGMDGMLIALIALMIVDYITGIMCAVIEKKLSSTAGFKGIAKKVLILMLVGVANLIDLHVLGSGSAIRGAVIAFYISNEGISVIENATRIGVPVPSKLKDVLAQIHGKEDQQTDKEG